MFCWLVYTFARLNQKCRFYCVQKSTVLFWTTKLSMCVICYVFETQKHPHTITLICATVTLLNIMVMNLKSFAMCIPQIHRFWILNSRPPINKSLNNPSTSLNPTESSNSNLNTSNEAICAYVRVHLLVHSTQLVLHTSQNKSSKIKK